MPCASVRACVMIFVTKSREGGHPAGEAAEDVGELLAVDAGLDRQGDATLVQRREPRGRHLMAAPPVAPGAAQKGTTI